ncbi:hypothetical protein PI124_g8784 [Phytophthora idaei]|nr:hypothetical protein PI124_g8784 [Phytophthora idaei]
MDDASTATFSSRVASPDPDKVVSDVIELNTSSSAVHRSLNDAVPCASWRSATDQAPCPMFRVSSSGCLQWKRPILSPCR